MPINAIFDASAASAPAGFETAVEAAVSYLNSVIATPMTVNIQFGWGEIAGQAMGANSLGESLPYGSFFTYSQVAAALASVATDSDETASVASLPTTDPTAGGQFFVNVAEQEALGLLATNYSGIAGYVGLNSTASYTFDPNNRAVSGDYDAIGILEHEITEVLGRDADLGLGQTDATNIYSPMDLFRYASAGVRDLTPDAAYFSINGTNLLDQWNNPLNGGDGGDWSTAVLDDSFDAFATPGVELPVSTTDLRLLDVLGFHPTAPAPATPPGTPTPSVGASSPMTETQNTTISSGQSVYIPFSASAADTTGYTLSGAVSLTDDGTITVISAAAAGDVGVSASVHGGTVQTGANAALYVEASASGAQATGFDGGAAAPNVVNDGLIHVVSSEGSATGVQTSDSTSSFTEGASDVLVAWGDASATGVAFTDGGSFSNAGTIQVTGYTPIGVEGASSFVNNGTIEATGVNGGAGGAIGVDITAPADGGPVLSTLTNNGTITADIAINIDGGSFSVQPNVTIDNAGRVNGAISLANGDDTVVNTGTIDGSIYFGDGDSTYNGAGGSLTGGAIYLGFGTNTVTLGADGEAVYGGFGSDTITGGSGNDFIEIGGGANTIDGGGGFNVLSFADSAIPVSVNLATGVATDEGTDTVKNIQEVIGTNWSDDVMTAGAAGQTLVAGTGGLTTMNGAAAGGDTFVLGASGGNTVLYGNGNHVISDIGEGAQTVFDFNSSDVLTIYGYASAESVTQNGNAVEIQLSEQDLIVLQDTSVSQINSSDVQYNSGFYPGLALPSSLAPWGTNTIYIEQNLTIAGDAKIAEQGQPYGFVNEGHSLDIAGQVTVSYPVEALSDYVYGWVDADTDEFGNPINPTNDTVTLTDIGSIAVSAPEGSAVGFAPLFDMTLSEGGMVSITAAGSAYGVDAPASVVNFNDNGSFPGAADLSVTAKGAAFGLALGDGGQIINSGLINVTAGTTAYAVQIDQAQGHTLTNIDDLSAYSLSSEPAFGIAAAGLASSNNPFTIDNSGYISAQTAITEYAGASDGGQLPDIAIVNTGTINGAIILDSRSASLVNSGEGTIAGDIMLSDDSASGPAAGDSIDLSGGASAGHIFIAPGSAGNIATDDVIKTGPSGGTISIAGGESNLSVSVTGMAGSSPTVAFDIASTQASETQNADGSWTVHAGTDGTETLSDVQSLQFTDKTVTLAAPSAVGNDYNGDDRGDFLIENTSGAVVVGEVGAGDLAGYTQVSGLGPEWKFVGGGDFLGDGRSAFLIENGAGSVDVGEVVNGQAQYAQVAGLGPEWKFVGAGDFLGDGKSDFLIENASGAVVVGEVGAGGQAAYTQVAGLGPEWSFVATGDFLGGGKAQFLIENTSGAVVVGALGAGDQAVYTQVAALGPEWKFEGAGDFLGTNSDQFLIENSAGAVDAGQVGANDQVTYTQVAALGPEWKFVGVGDYLDEGHDQFLIENTAGAVFVGDYTGASIHFTQVAGLGPEWGFH